MWAVGRFPLEIHAWTIPLLFATGLVIGYGMFRTRLRRRHPDLYMTWLRRTSPDQARQIDQAGGLEAVDTSASEKEEAAS